MSMVYVGGFCCLTCVLCEYGKSEMEIKIFEPPETVLLCIGKNAGISMFYAIV